MVEKFNDDFMNVMGLRWANANELNPDDPYYSELVKHNPNATYAVDSDGYYVSASRMGSLWDDYVVRQEQPDLATAREVEMAQQHRANEEFNRQVDNLFGGNWMRPSQIVGAFNPGGVDDGLSFGERLLLGTNNYGLWSPNSEFLHEHPYLAEGINMAFDFAAPTAFKGVGRGTLGLGKYYVSRPNGQILRNAVYDNVYPFSYGRAAGSGSKKRQIANAIIDFLNPSYEFNSEILPKALRNAGVTEADATNMARDQAWRKAMRIPSRPGEPQIYKPNGDGTFSYDYNAIDNLVEKANNIRQDNGLLEIKDQDRPYAIPAQEPKVGESILIEDPTLGKNGGHGTLTHNKNGTYSFYDKWDLHPLERYKWVPKVLRQQDWVSAVGGFPFELQTNMPVMFDY